MAKRPRVFVTVGMGPWPFDRLLEAVRPLCDSADVFAQTGASALTLPCRTVSFLSPDEVEKQLRTADVVVTHAGNTVRLAQRAGQVPVAVAREAARGEMGNDHQVEYLKQEQRHGRVIAVWDVAQLADVVAAHDEVSARVEHRVLPNVVDGRQLADQMDELVDQICAPRSRSTPGWATPLHQSTVRAGSAGRGKPFRWHPLRRYAFAWDRVAAMEGPHLDVGVGMGDFAGPLASGTTREVHGVDVHPGYVEAVRTGHPHVRSCLAPLAGPLPYNDAMFASLTMLDVLEHAADEASLLAEAYRVLWPGGIVVVSVPRRHVFSFADPDNAKYRWPRLHRWLYTARFGAAAYHERFQDVSDGLRGDMAATRDNHTNYRTEALVDMVTQAGLEVVEVAGANLFWRFLQVPSLFVDGRVKAALGSAIAVDGMLFRWPRIAANLFVVARRPR
jgi:SAM-dependent methyltransferase